MELHNDAVLMIVIFKTATKDSNYLTTILYRGNSSLFLA